MRLSDVHSSILVSTIFPLILLGVTGFLSFSHLTESPPVWYDEGTYSQIAENSALYGIDGFQIAPHTFESAWSVNGGFPFIMPITLSYKLFGVGVLQGRVVMAIFILLFSVASYLLIRRLYGPSHALGALLLLTTFPVLYGTGKNILGEVPGLLYLILFLLLLQRIERQQFCSKWWVFFGAGITLGLCIVTKPLFLVLLGALGIVGLLHFRSIPWARSWMIVSALGLALPILVHIATHMLGANMSSLASYYANPYAETALGTTIFQNLLRFFREASPLYCILVYGVWALSIIRRAYRKLPIPLIEEIAFFFSAFVLLFYLRTAGWYRYFFTANILALLFFPSSIADLFAGVRTHFARLKKELHYVPLVAVLCLASLQTYQLLFTSWVAVHNASIATALLQTEFEAFGGTPSIFFLNTPEIVLFAKGNPYYQYMTPAPGLQIGTQELAILAAGEPDIVVVKQSEQKKYSDYLVPYTLRSSPGDYAIYQRPL